MVPPKERDVTEALTESREGICHIGFSPRKADCVIDNWCGVARGPGFYRFVAQSDCHSDEEIGIHSVEPG
ncbi:hypothetical protein PoB_000445200 [Plakobranchus ocellatus]|uniref:Uncharacterized protein n=1 Tax=Plakobranchus ocellatus TaxID=259542 RepID=A0AAV3Y761_9GAST|nr:hypothetical protein PoB_000445200 [Plakobranchus ocellatus]